MDRKKKQKITETVEEVFVEDVTEYTSYAVEVPAYEVIEEPEPEMLVRDGVVTEYESYAVEVLACEEVEPDAEMPMREVAYEEVEPEAEMPVRDGVVTEYAGNAVEALACKEVEPVDVEPQEVAKQDGSLTKRVGNELIRSCERITNIETEMGVIKKTLDNVLNALEKLSSTNNNTADQSHPHPVIAATLERYMLYDVQNRYVIAEGHANPLATPGAIVQGRPMQEYERKVFVFSIRDATHDESLYLGNQGSATTIGHAIGDFVVWPIYLMHKTNSG